MTIRFKALMTALTALASLSLQAPAFADPPSWAPAYGPTIVPTRTTAPTRAIADTTVTAAMTATTGTTTTAS